MVAISGYTNGMAESAASQIIPLWREGKEISTSQTIDVVSPLTTRTIYKAYTANEENALEAIAAAHAALPSWRETKPTFRRDLFLRAADELLRQKDDLWRISHEEVAATEGFFGFDFNGALEALRSLAGLITTVEQGTMLSQLADDGRSAMLVPEPYGVVLAMAPWNAPYTLGFRSVLGPLAMGNTVVLKGPEWAPGCCWALARVLYAAGLPPGCLQTLIVDPRDASRVTDVLVAAPQVKKVNFTGSTPVGSLVGSLCGKHLKPVVLELGGKAPAIVCEDADVQLAAASCAAGALLNAGQICMSTERILVNAAVADAFRQALTAAIDGMVASTEGSGLVLVDPAPVGRNHQLVQDALSKGAEALYGNVDSALPLATAMRPIVVEGTSVGMDLYHTESFGPTVSLIVVRDDDEAVAIANDTDYGLSSAVFTRDLRRGIAIARRIETGAVHINDMSVHDEAALPHGGAKKSGFGRFNGVEGLKEWVRLKSITWDA